MSRSELFYPTLTILQRAYADAPKPSINDSKAAVLPGSQSTGTSTPPVPGLPDTPPTTIAGSTVHPANIPLTPPPPPSTVQTSKGSSVPPLPPPGASTVASHPPSPSTPKPKRRFRNFIISLVLLSGLGFAGGVWYSTRSDNFHDFFTEYVPFGEEAVLYLEEREFRKRHPRFSTAPSRPSSDAAKVTIPSGSGISWKDRAKEPAGSDLETKGRHMSAVEDTEAASDRAVRQSPAQVTQEKKADPKKLEQEARQSPTVAEQEKKADSLKDKDSTSAKDRTAKTGGKPTEAMTSGKETVPNTATSGKPVKLPEVNEPSVFVPLSRIDPMKVNDGDEPLVQELVKMLNDIILVVNEDNSTGKYTSSITKAKGDLERVGQRIKMLKAQEHQAAQKDVEATQLQFDNAAKELVRRLELEMQDQESRWREEFESERKKIETVYEERLSSELERAKEVTDQKIRNQLLEQAIALKNDFASTIQDKVETERQGRLAKLDALSSSINELEGLTVEWNKVLDANLRTQHLQVAVEAVKSGLDRTDRPRPFIRELAALKELAAENSIVDSAIASINPASYQLGIPTSAQLIDRFRRVADEVRKAALLPEDAGIASHAASLLLSKVMFKKQGRAEGDDVESILTRTESLLEEGKLDEAAREMNTLQGWAKTLSRDWLSEVRKVLEVKQALDVSNMCIFQ